jgi:signal transduction histidine kinase
MDALRSAARGRVDTAGLLIEADPRLLTLILSGGGAVGRLVPFPELAGVVRLATRLGVVITREVTLATNDGQSAVVHVRATPSARDVTLEVDREDWAPLGTSDIMVGDRVVMDRSGADLVWEADAALRLTQLIAQGPLAPVLDAETWLGRPAADLFGIDVSVRLNDQLAELIGYDLDLRITAEPMRDHLGRIGRIRGTAVVASSVSAPAGSPFPDGFGVRLDKALRRPLQRIIATANSMSAGLEGPLAPSYAGYADDIATAGRHLLSLVEDLVDLEAVERDDFATVEEPIDLADIARRAAGLLQVRASESDVRIDRPALDEALPAVGDFRRVLQVLVNIIGNAVRYSPAGGMVWVRLERDGDDVAAIVADQGKGIAAEDQTRIFEKFERLDSSEPGGSGLGLYISRRLARAMGGDITVDSAPGQGARFIFTLPAR